MKHFTSSLSEKNFWFGRCRELDRYMNRLVKHPVIRKDPDFRTFLQEGKLAATLNVRKGLGRAFTDAFSGVSQV
jgi:hypothetical protein